MTLRLLGRSNDQASAAQSAAIVVPKWRIGFLIMPTVISILSSRFERSSRYGAAAAACQP